MQLIAIPMPQWIIYRSAMWNNAVTRHVFPTKNAKYRVLYVRSAPHKLQNAVLGVSDFLLSKIYQGLLSIDVHVKSIHVKGLFSEVQTDIRKNSNGA